MSKDEKSCIRVRKGADDCSIEDCIAYVNEDSNRSLVDTAAKNTRVKNSHVFEIKKGFKKFGKVTVVLIAVGFIADMIALVSTGNHLIHYVFK